MKRLLFTLILVVGLTLRFYRLGAVPPSLDWDEASLGWNGYSLVKTGSDEYGKAWPVSLRSFNDYKPPLYGYAVALVTAAFGLSEWSVRLPSALAGMALVLFSYFLAKALFVSQKAALAAMLLTAVSPWSIQFSRVAFEANLATGLFCAGATTLVFFLRRKSFPLLLTSFVLLVFSMYSYHSPRLVVPVFLAAVGFWYKTVFIQKAKETLLALFVVVILLYPLLRNTFHTGSLVARFQNVSAFAVFNPGEPATFWELGRTLIRNYSSHFNFDFLFLTSDGNPRHHAPDIGLVLLFEAPFLAAGFYQLIKWRSFGLPLFVIWFLVAPLASSVAADAPHAVRSLLFLPTFSVIAAYGVVTVAVKKASRVVVFGVALAFLANVFYFVHQYFVHLPREFASGWQYGYKEVVEKVREREDEYERIYVTTVYGQPYIYFLFYGRIDPVVKNNGLFHHGVDKYIFSDYSESLGKEVAGDKVKALYVFDPKGRERPKKIIDEVDFPSGQAAFGLGEN